VLIVVVLLLAVGAGLELVLVGGVVADWIESMIRDVRQVWTDLGWDLF
jgi:hypothetical protein